VERCPFDADAILLSPAEMAGYLGRAKLRLMRRDYIVFMPRFLRSLRPLEPCRACFSARTAIERPRQPCQPRLEGRKERQEARHKNNVIAAHET